MKNVFLVFTIFAFFSCKNESKTISKFDWLLGNWENKTNGKYFSENWQKTNSSDYKGLSYILVGKDTVFKENVLIENKNDSVFYQVKSKQENYNKVTSFALIKQTENQLIFENKKHDFPTQIIYNKITTDSIFAQIKGFKNGKMVLEGFPMKRKNN